VLNTVYSADLDPVSATDLDSTAFRSPSSASCDCLRREDNEKLDNDTFSVDVGMPSTAQVLDVSLDKSLFKVACPTSLTEEDVVDWRSTSVIVLLVDSCDHHEYTAVLAASTKQTFRQFG
jgi:hypothetical protein